MAVLKDHERAKKAWELVNRIPSDKADAYAPLVKSAPVMILTNGLGQTLAFFISKKKKGELWSALQTPRRLAFVEPVFISEAVS